MLVITREMIDAGVKELEDYESRYNYTHAMAVQLVFIVMSDKAPKPDAPKNAKILKETNTWTTNLSQRIATWFPKLLRKLSAS